MKVKVLALDSWMKCEYLRDDTLKHGNYTETVSIFNRPGRYLKGDKCWFELPDGRAFIDPHSEYFKYELSLLEASRLTRSQVAALHEVVKQGLSTKKQKVLLYNYNCWEENRRVYRNAILSRIKFLGR